jgi:hypothetical protein
MGGPLAWGCVSPPRPEARTSSGISIQTLIIASLSSVAAALFIHEVWKGGAILGAAVTPIIVGIVSEALKRPAERLTTVRASGRRLPQDRERDVPPASRERGDDPFGLWEQQAPRRGRGRTWLALGVVTGVIGFAVAAFTLTGTELVFGGSVGSDRKTTIFGGTRTVQTTTVQTVTQTTRTQVPTVTQTVPAPAPQEQSVPTVTQTVPTVPPAGVAPQQQQQQQPAPTTPTAPVVPAP